MASNDTKNSAYDTRKYVICKPWFGRKGPEYSRRFRPEFIGGLHAHADRFASLYDHVMGADPGGTPLIGDPNPNPHTGTPTVMAESQLAYTAG